MKVQKLSIRIESFYNNYINDYYQALKQVDINQINKAAEAITQAHLSRSRVFACGNGGSAAISDHLMCDHSKGVNTDTSFIPDIMSLSSNMSLITAIGNDISYENIFSYQLDMFGKSGDVLVAISSSGNSPNIVKAIETAKKSNITTIALVGFDGGAAKDIADIPIHINANNYGIVEDSHQSIMHILAQFIRVRYNNNSTPLKL